MENKHKIVLFDGVCNLCNGAVIFMIKRDREDRIRFAALQSDVGKRLVTKYRIDTKNVDSIIFIDGDKAYDKSSAALHIAFYLKSLYPLLYGLLIVPRTIRDGVYDYIARNRYSWYGKKESCMIPTPELKAKFLD
jgi:predicted DCC family thiol-disulfide oxidoreductase YuxK